MSCLVLSCLVLSCLVLSCLVLSCLVLSSLLSSFPFLSFAFVDFLLFVFAVGVVVVVVAVVVVGGGGVDGGGVNIVVVTVVFSFFSGLRRCRDPFTPREQIGHTRYVVILGKDCTTRISAPSVESIRRPMCNHYSATGTTCWQSSASLQWS